MKQRPNGVAVTPDDPSLAFIAYRPAHLIQRCGGAGFNLNLYPFMRPTHPYPCVYEPGLYRPVADAELLPTRRSDHPVWYRSTTVDTSSGRIAGGVVSMPRARR